MKPYIQQCIKYLIYTFDIVCILIILLAILLFIVAKFYFKSKRKEIYIDGRVRKAKVVAFFHPYANSCGGGEKVLWAAVQGLQEIAEFQPIHCIIYTGDKESKEEILEKTKRILHFDIKPSFSLEIVHLTTREWLEPKYYRHFTILFQSLGSMIVAFDALHHCVPDIFCDTTGHAFTYPVVKLLTGSKVLSYTHYPTISTDMLQRVREQRVEYNNNAFISNSVTISYLKLFYYHLFSGLYSLVGRCADLVLVNGTWTYNHIVAQWRQPTKTSILYPPCDTIEHQAIPINKPRERFILSLGQFRPEKDHVKQLYILRKLLDLDSSFEDIRLVLIGGCRNEGDFKRVEELKRIVADLGMEDKVLFEVNASYETLQHYLSICSVGLHTMWNEHFGICVVEYMAAGLIVVAHNSAGPKSDIVLPAYPHTNSNYEIEEEKKACGFLAASIEEYVSALEFIFSHEKELQYIRENARERACCFSTEKFIKGFKEKLSSMLY